MKDWNVVLTAYMNRGRQLLRIIGVLGEFQSSGFHEVFVGRVPEVAEFLDHLHRQWQEDPELSEVLSTVVPVRQVFPFTLENLLPQLQEATRQLLGEIGDARFYVRMKRRGHKGELSSLAVEQELDAFLKEECARRGQNCHIDFDQADKIIIIETIHNQCGIGLVTQEMKARYPFIKIK
ncbi:MAG: THUMP domain-containing protein [Desulfobacteraceae bacterium]